MITWRYWIFIPAIEKAPVVSMPGGIPRGSLPKTKRTTLSTTIPSATVAISQELEPRSPKGRTARRSTRRPHAAHPRRASGTAAGSGQPNVTQAVKHRTAPSIIVLPWAKLTVLDTAWVTWKPSASSPYMLPRPRPEMSAEATSIDCTPPYARRPVPPPLRRSVHRNNLIAHIVHHDVVFRSKCIMIARRERLRVGLD